MELLENPRLKIFILEFDAPYKLYLYLIQAGRGVVGWEGNRSGGGGGGGGGGGEYHRNYLCNRLITVHTHPQAAAFAKDQAGNKHE